MEDHLEEALRCVRFEPQRGHVEAPGDRVLFEQALVAVLRNAVDASPEEGRITVTTSYGNSGMVTVTTGQSH